jgi:hypothetical protein
LSSIGKDSRHPPGDIDMSKKKKKTPLTAANAAVAGEHGTCVLRKIDGTTDFEGATGNQVQLFTHDHVGAVLIAKAEYGGDQLIPPGQAVSTVTFDVKAGRNTLKAVFVFSASTNGRGELREDCGNNDSQFLRALAGDEPLQVMRIFGK